MTPSFIGRYAIIFPGVRPIISFASFPTARILLSATETATTDGSLSTIPFPGTKTRTVVVPRSIPSLGENEKDMRGIVRQNRKIQKSLALTPPQFSKVGVARESKDNPTWR